MRKTQFIQKWLGNPDRPYNEQMRDEMWNDLDAMMDKKFEPKDIEAEAEAFADSHERRGCAYWNGLYRGYIKGATRDNRLREAAEKVMEMWNIHRVSWEDINEPIEELEKALK